MAWGCTLQSLKTNYCVYGSKTVVAENKNTSHIDPQT